MNIINKTAFILFMAISFSLSSAATYAAEEAASASAANKTVVISNIEKGLIEVSKSDFSAAQVVLKAARTASERLDGNSDVVKKAQNFLIQGQIKAKLGDVEKSTAELNKALELYKSL